MSSLTSHENQVFVWIESREPILINSIRMKYDPRCLAWEEDGVMLIMWSLYQVKTSLYQENLH